MIILMDIHLSRPYASPFHDYSYIRALCAETLIAALAGNRLPTYPKIKVTKIVLEKTLHAEGIPKHSASF